MPRKRRVPLCFFAALLFMSLGSGALASPDPVARFIARADSLVRAASDSALAASVELNSIIVASAVGQLLDAAIAAEEAADAAGARSQMALAERLARLYQEKTGSGAALKLAAAYRHWSAEERAMRAEAKLLEKDASAAQKGGDPDKAVQLYREARDIYEKIGDTRSLALTWGSLGVVQWSRGDMGAVRECYDKALAARREIEDRILEGRTLNGLGSVSFMTGDYAAALEYYQSAVDLRRRTNDLSGLGVSLTYVGNSYARLGRLGDAKDAYRDALAVLEISGTQAQIIDGLNGAASVNSEMGQFALSDGAYRTAIALAMSSGEPAKEASCRINLADNLRSEGRYRDALGALDTLRTLLGANPDPVQNFEFHRSRGLTYLTMGETDPARQDLVTCLDESRTLDDPLHSIEALVNLGYLYREIGAFGEGLSSANNARARAEEAGNVRMIREAAALAADIDRLMGRFEEALAQWRGVLDRDMRDGFASSELIDRLNIANVLADQKKTGEARAAFRDAIPLIRSSGLGDLEWILDFGIADTYERENADSAYSRYEAAFGLLERERQSIGGAGLQTGFLSGDRRRLFEEVANYYASLATGPGRDLWSARAFAVIERGKARGLLDMLEKPLGAQGSPEEGALLDSLYRLDRKAPGAGERERTLRSRYVELRDQRLARSLGALAPAGGTIDLATVQKRLSKGTVLLEYALGDSTSLLWAVDRDRHDVYRLPGRSALSLEVERFRDAVARPGIADAVFTKTARSLYLQLIEPAAQRVTKAQRLVIVPDGVLFDLPFDALLAQEPKVGKGWRDQPFVARRWSTIYCPSASVYASIEDREERASRDLDLLAMGDSDFSHLAPGDWGPLAPLPNSRAEVEGISSGLDPAHTAVFVGADASEARLKAEIRDHSPRVVHLATHGLVDAIEPIRSCVVLSPSENPKEDGYLYTLEIITMPVNADLVVLSACESARGMIGRGEGVVGLSRAFIGSGARGVVASLWAVSDVSTAELMKSFYASMFKGRTPACKALEKARVSLLDDPTYAHPFYWSPFIVIGTERTPW